MALLASTSGYQVTSFADRELALGGGPAGRSCKDGILAGSTFAGRCGLKMFSNSNIQRSLISSCTGEGRRERRERRDRRFAVRAQSQLESTLGPKGDGNVTEIFGPDDFEKQIKEAGDKLVVLDIATKTCGPCRFIYPKIVDLSLEYPDIVFLKIFGDHSPETRALMREWGIRAVPNFRFYRSGELIHKHSGAKLEDLTSNIKKFRSAPSVSS